MSKPKLNEIEKIINHPYLGIQSERWLRRKLRALVKKACVFGINKATIENQFGGNELREVTESNEKDFKEMFGCKP